MRVGKPTRHKQYFELLKSPKWQRKRLEIMDRDDFACVRCDERESELQVHHAYYEANRDPWDYPDESLSTLCSPCHEKAERMRVRLRAEVGTCRIQERVLGYVLALKAEDDPLLEIPIDGIHEAEGVGAHWCLGGDLVVDIAAEFSGGHGGPMRVPTFLLAFARMQILDGKAEPKRWFAERKVMAQIALGGYQNHKT